MSDKLKEPPGSSRDSTMEAKNAVEVPLAGAEGKPKIPNIYSRFDWDVLKSQKGILKVTQVVLGIIIIGLEHPRPRSPYTEADYILFFVAFYGTLATLVFLINALQKTHYVEKTFGSKFWSGFELRYTGIVGIVFQILACWVLIRALNFWWVPELNVVGSVFAFLVSIAYLVDWWRLFSEQQHASTKSKSTPTVEQIVVETK
ncbi:uncharacterized protein LOC131425327 [Malaya genurostris]|uniref:uncharacterized protein LOC131425327 n=1 Tax=Malaya genurostris TaxID=325434 RepID=UPI0026F39509|nr:uncharacterized protein LOC131425327 [Malaya genurostris]